MTDETAPIRHLHGIYQDISGLPVTLTMPKIYQWRAWMAMGWTEEDLKLTMRMVLKKVNDKSVSVRVFRFEYFIGNTERFDEDLAEARALARVKKPDVSKASVLRATGRPEQLGLGDNCKSAESVMRANAGLAELLKLRDSL